MKRILTTIVALGAMGLISCGGAPPQSESATSETATSAGAPADTAAYSREEAEAKAREASKALMSELKGELVSALGEGGPPHAIGVCSEKAPQIAAHFTGDDFSVRRVSRKVRNPADEPDAYERAVLEEFAAEKARGELPDEHVEVVESETGGEMLRYMKPIVIAKPCLACHGTEETLHPGVMARLEELYPNDEATGYEEGDLRGAVSVTASLR